MSKSYIFGVVFGIVLLTVGVVAGSNQPIRLQQEVAGSKLQQIDEEALYKAEIKDATPVQLGLLANKQLINSRIYTHYLQLTGFQTINNFVASIKGKTKIATIITDVPLLPEPE